MGAVGDSGDFKSYRAAADVFFSLWLNKPPVELANDIVPYKRQIDEPKVYERNAFARRALQREAHVLALKLLLEQSVALRQGLPRVSRCACTHARTHGCMHACMHARTYGMHACVCACAQLCMCACTHARTHASTQARVCEGFARLLRRTGYVSNSTLSLTRPDAYSSCAADDCVLISSMSAVDPPSRHLDGSMIGQRLHALLQREVVGCVMSHLVGSRARSAPDPTIQTTP